MNDFQLFEYLTKATMKENEFEKQATTKPATHKVDKALITILAQGFTSISAN